MYQGKNATNVFIPEEAWQLPMMQKAVINAIVLVNWQAILTVFKNYIWTTVGWENIEPHQIITKGTSLIKLNLVNEILFGEWIDTRLSPSSPVLEYFR